MEFPANKIIVKRKSILLNFSAVFLSFIFIGVNAVFAVPAFPGAEGFGANTKGGRGGKVIEVTNLNDSGPGSLRQCAGVETGPRICVFRVAGTITLNSDIEVVNPYLTIVGQTAPGGGITVKAASSNSTVHLKIRAPEVIVRYIRLRPGTNRINSRALSMNNGATSMSSAVKNIMIDHNSFSWAGDELTIAWLATNNISYQWNIAAESFPPLDDSAADVGIKGPSFGETGGGFYSVHHNLIAHHTQRLPQVSASAGIVDIVNNLIYNPGGLGSSAKNGAQVNYVKNYIRQGPNTKSGFTYISDEIGGAKGPAKAIYIEGNFLDGIQNLINSTTHVVLSRLNAPTVTTTSPQVAYDEILKKAGASQGLDCLGNWMIRYDSIDARIIQSVIDGSRGHNVPLSQTFQQRGYISRPSDVGGWPNLAAGTACPDDDHDGMPNEWEQQKGLNLSQNDSGGYSLNPNYTNIEMYINGSDNVITPSITATPTPTGNQNQTPTPTLTGSTSAAKLKFKVVLPDITTNNIPAGNVQLEMKDGSSSVVTGNVALTKSGTYYQTSPEVSLNIPQNKSYTILIKTNSTIRRSFTGVSLTSSQTLDCTVSSNSACGELISQRDTKLLLSGDSDGFNSPSGSFNKIDSADLQKLSTYFNQSATSNASQTDFNLDGTVNISDLEILGKNYLRQGD